MSELIKAEIENAVSIIKTLTGNKISENMAFNHILLKFYFDEDFSKQLDDQLVTDGPNDGGIDFVYYDEEEDKLIVCQSKYTSALSCEDINSEFNKMHSTVNNFMRANTGMYNSVLKYTLQNAIDRLPEDNSGNVEYRLFTTANINTDEVKSKIEKLSPKYPLESIVINTYNDIDEQIQKTQGEIPTVSEARIRIDKAKNYLKYESVDSVGILCNVSSTSIVQLYNKFLSVGLFNLNIRRYIRHTSVDTGIKNTLNTNRDNFWFLNNGIIIACEEFEVDGNRVNLYNFSIVNGGQTTHLIATHKGPNTSEFYLPCKIVATKDEKRSSSFFTGIAEATNSQKPIFARDLKSNTPEMVSLARWLKRESIYLEIKRGVSPEKGFRPKIKIKNDELGQLILSFRDQRPGTARSGKKTIFENQGIYKQLYQENYLKDPSKKQFILDLIYLNERYKDVENKLKHEGRLTKDHIAILQNGKLTIFALLGVCYMLVNEVITEQQIIENPKILPDVVFEYGAVLSNYKDDDIDYKLKQIVVTIVKIVTEAYLKVQDGTTSPSNFMKTDPKYYNDIVTKFMDSFDYQEGREIKLNWDIFKR